MENMQKQNMKSNISAFVLDDASGDAFVNDYLLYIMAHASHAVSKTFHSQLNEKGVSVPEWRILACLYPDKTMNVGELARKCLIKQPTLTRQLDRLCAEGLTERLHESGDRRGVLVALTKRGMEQTHSYVVKAKAHEAEVLQDYSEEEIAALKAALRLLARNAAQRG